MSAPLTSAERIGAALQHREGDRVPFVLPATMHPARMLGLSLREYFGSAEAVIEGQLRFREAVGHDALIAFLHVAGELEAFGGEPEIYEDGPENTGPPPLRPADLERLRAPDPLSSAALRRTLEVARGLVARADGKVPVLAGAVAPFSLPVAQLGFPAWLDLLRERPDLARRLLAVNAEFTAAWVGHLHAAGVALVLLFDPLASPQMVPEPTWSELGLPFLRGVVAGARGAIGLSTASAPCLRVLPRFIEAGAALVAASGAEDLAAAKAVARGRAVLAGNLDGIRMRRWSPADVEREVQAALAAGAPGGGFVLFEHHGEVPLQVPLEVLIHVGEAVRRLGAYPLRGG